MSITDLPLSRAARIARAQQSIDRLTDSEHARDEASGGMRMSLTWERCFRCESGSTFSRLRSRGSTGISLAQNPREEFLARAIVGNNGVGADANQAFALPRI